MTLKNIFIGLKCFRQKANFVAISLNKACAELAVYLNLLCGILVFSIVVPKPVSVSGPFYHTLGYSWPYFNLIKEHRKIECCDEMSC